MAELPEVFSPADIPEDDRNFDPIPAGTYTMQVIESKLEDTKTGSGQMLVLTLEVMEGEHANQRIWDRLNIVNDSADAQRIAQRALANLCIAIGVEECKDSEELHFKPFEAKVTIQRDKSGQYGPQNRVRYPSGEAATAPPASKAAPQRPAAGKAAQAKPAANSKGAKPWQKGASRPEKPPF